jgi:hypothetical protein
MTHLDISNTSYGKKKATKSRESPWFHYVQVMCDILLESSRQGLIFFFRPNLHQRSAHKVIGPQSHKSPNFGQNDIWVLVLWPCTKYTIRGKVVASPKFELWWVLWVHICSWFVCAPKCYKYALTNLLFGLCKFVWVIELFVNLLSPILELQHAFLPLKCYKPGSAPQFLLSLSTPLDLQLSPSRSLGVCHNMVISFDITFSVNGIQYVVSWRERHDFWPF